MSQTVKFTFLNVAYRPTVYETGQKQSEYFLFFQIIPLPWVFLWTVLQYYRYIRTVTLSYSLASFLAGLDRNWVYGSPVRQNCSAELLLFSSAQMTEHFSAEHRTFFFNINCIFQNGYLRYFKLDRKIKIFCGDNFRQK